MKPVKERKAMVDKNDKEIYVGDLFAGFGEGIKYFELRLENGEFVMYQNYGRWGSLVRFFEVCRHLSINVIVIGNIYQNPELLN